MVLVAFGTSCPEAGVGIIAAFKKQTPLAFGNVVGSNIANIGLIIGICALVRPLKVDKSIFKLEVPLMLAALLLLCLLTFDLYLSRFDGLLLILSFAAFLFFSYRSSRRSFSREEIADFKFNKTVARLGSRPKVLAVAVISLVGIVVGAQFMVDRGVKLAELFGVSPWIIGITVFAIGTSLPELVASLVAAFRKIPSLSVGNIVGSNIFNVLFVLGLVSLIRPIAIESKVMLYELPLLLIFSFVFFTVLRTRYKISRWEGLALLSGYLAFIIFLLKR
jgi:cation:H+ antiporter